MLLAEDSPLEFNPCFTAVSLMLSCKDRVLCLQRHPNVTQGGKWGFPTGKREPGESKRGALAREIFEETGARIEESTFSFFRDFRVQGQFGDFLYSLFHLELIEKPTIKLNPCEHTEYRWTSPSDWSQIDWVDDMPAVLEKIPVEQWIP